MKTFLLFLLMLAQTGSAFAKMSSGRDYLSLLRNGNLTTLYGLLTPSLRNHFQNFENFKNFHAQAPIRILIRQEELDGVFRAVYADNEFVRVLDISLDKEGLVSGIRLGTDDGSHPYPSPHADAVLPQAFRFPLPSSSGPWTVLGKHHVAARSQRYAYDLLIIKNGKSHEGNPVDIRSYYAYGQTVLSPFDGTVVEVHDGEPDMNPGDMSSSHPGNFILIKADEKVYLFLAHFQKGILVKAGQSVVAGQQVGRVGNSGHSSEPHLHIEAFDKLPRQQADGYPLYFQDVIHNGAAINSVLAAYGDTLQAGGDL